MIYDLEQQTGPDESHYDHCIIGSGPAGITLALSLAAANKKVLLLEAGGRSYTNQSQSFYQCESSARSAWPSTTRLRYLGGTSNHWAGRCRPFEAEDFESEQLAKLPGWPISYSEIEGYLMPAKEILGIDKIPFHGKTAKLNADFIADEYINSTPVKFGEKYYDQLKNSSDINLYLNANAYSLNVEKGQLISSVGAKNYQGDSFKFLSSNFILAMGTIENARFLLNQNAAIKKISNENGMIGKCFMEHMNIKLGEFLLNDEGHTQNKSYFTSDKFIQEFETGRSNISFGVTDQVKSYGRTAKIKTFFKNLACDYGIEEKVQFISGFTCPGTGVIGTLMEQFPDKESFVSLSHEKDSMGLRKAVLHWQINEEDHLTIRTIAKKMAMSFADAGLGIVKLEQYILDEALDIPVGPHAHHMGTTRMAKSPEHGVVDENCKVFGVENLYVAGSSIFSTGGACNPTMPIVQFALRLSDHLLKKSTS